MVIRDRKFLFVLVIILALVTSCAKNMFPQDSISEQECVPGQCDSPVDFVSEASIFAAEDQIFVGTAYHIPDSGFDKNTMKPFFKSLKRLKYAQLKFRACYYDHKDEMQQNFIPAIKILMEYGPKALQLQKEQKILNEKASQASELAKEYTKQGKLKLALKATKEAAAHKAKALYIYKELLPVALKYINSNKKIVEASSCIDDFNRYRNYGMDYTLAVNKTFPDVYSIAFDMNPSAIKAASERPVDFSNVKVTKFDPTNEDLPILISLGSSNGTSIDGTRINGDEKSKGTLEGTLWFEENLRNVNYEGSVTYIDNTGVKRTYEFPEKYPKPIARKGLTLYINGKEFRAGVTNHNGYMPF